VGRIKLDDDLEMRPPIRANEVHDSVITVNHDSINVRLDWKHQEYDQQDPPQPVGDPVLVRSEHYAITGTHFDELIDTTIAPPQVGRPLMRLFRRAVRNKVKELKALQGTVE